MLAEAAYLRLTSPAFVASMPRSMTIILTGKPELPQHSQHPDFDVSMCRIVVPRENRSTIAEM